MCPIVPMFTCGFDRSNFSLPMTARLLVLAGACTGVQVNTSNETKLVGSVVRVQLEELLSQLRRDALETGEIEFANLALVGVAEPAVLRRGRLSQNSLAEDGLEVANAKLRALQRSQEVLDLA